MKPSRPPSWWWLLAWVLLGLVLRATWCSYVPPPEPQKLHLQGDPFDWDGGQYETRQNTQNDHRVIVWIVNLGIVGTGLRLP